MNEQQEQKNKLEKELEFVKKNNIAELRECEDFVMNATNE